jgi:solute carrier family 31 (copper transporter), member 1
MEYRHTEAEAGAGAAAADASMAGHDHGTADGDCKISMLLNFHTVGACFFSEGWKITSVGMFAGSCIGVVLLCFLLEFLRRGVKEFDKFLVKQHIAKHTAASVVPASLTDESDPKAGLSPGSYPPFRPNMWQQAARAVLHTTQFTVAYFIMLIGMSVPSFPDNIYC